MTSYTSAMASVLYYPARMRKGSCNRFCLSSSVCRRQHKTLGNVHESCISVGHSYQPHPLSMPCSVLCAMRMPKLLASCHAMPAVAQIRGSMAMCTRGTYVLPRALVITEVVLIRTNEVVNYIHSSRPRMRAYIATCVYLHSFLNPTLFHPLRSNSLNMESGVAVV